MAGYHARQANIAQNREHSSFYNVRRAARTSKRAIALSGGVREDIAAWRTFVLDDGPEAWVFPSEKQHSAVTG